MISQDVSMRGNKTQGKKENTHHQFKVIFKYDVVLVVVVVGKGGGYNGRGLTVSLCPSSGQEVGG